MSEQASTGGPGQDAQHTSQPPEPKLVGGSRLKCSRCGFEAEVKTPSSHGSRSGQEFTCCGEPLEIATGPAADR